MKPITVLIVDDSALIREMFSLMLSSEPGIEVAGVASDPIEARQMIKQLNPDVLTLDIEMPKMDGISFLEKIMALHPMPVIMVSWLTQKGAEETLRALEIGAFDYVSKPVVAFQTRDTIGSLKDELVAKVRAAGQANIAPRARAKPASASCDVITFNPPQVAPVSVIAIGASTGGVEALRDIFLLLPANCPPIVVTQHMPQTFTRSFAARLDSLSQVSVAEACNHMRLRDGHAYLAPGNLHLKIVKIGTELVCKLEDTAAVSSHKPSVDVLFHSVAEAAGARAVGVILTGMGRDGALGMRVLRNCGAYTIGQNKASCVIYGMPQAAAKAGGVQDELPLAEIPGKMLRYCEKPGSAG